ncbi:MAG: hypothetical protein P1U89_25525 [Verrucomicrobiales bacterium]|nr:hypothetical protein [Verrucomicrobiales bacterium]
MKNNQKLIGATVEYFLCPETIPLPNKVSGFKFEDYRSTGIVLPFKEFSGPVEAMIHATFMGTLERRFTVGDAFVLRFPAIHRISTFVCVSRRAPLVFQNATLRLFQANNGKGDFALQLPKSFTPAEF